MRQERQPSSKCFQLILTSVRRFKHHGPAAEDTVLQQLNQGRVHERVVLSFVLDFFGTFCVKTKSTEQKTQNM
jgi:hypothetical protein